MNRLANHYLEDISHVAQSLTVEENMMAIKCAQKVKSHLERSVKNGNAHHQRNLTLVEGIIDTHRKKLNEAVGTLSRFPLAS